MVGSCGTGHAVIRSITFDVGEALVEAEVVLVSAMAKRHEAITDWIAPHLKGWQIVCFSAGNCASITLKKKRGDKKVIVGEMQGNIGSCRLVSPTKEIKGNPHALLPPSYDCDSEYLRITGTPRKVSE